MVPGKQCGSSEARRVGQVWKWRQIALAVLSDVNLETSKTRRRPSAEIRMLQ